MEYSYIPGNEASLFTKDSKEGKGMDVAWCSMVANKAFWIRRGYTNSEGSLYFITINHFSPSRVRKKTRKKKKILKQ